MSGGPGGVSPRLSIIRAVFGEIDHIGIAVADLDESVALYRDRLGMREQHRETVEEQGVHAVLLEIGDAHVELISPIGGDGSVARFIERNGDGMHHVAYRTGDIDATIGRLVASGMRMIDEEPRIGIRGSRVAFVHPKSTGGVLTEIVQPAEDH
jgi:methylmalonyl-CoA/ethylmalonyl-CoA epimerase